MSTKNEQDCNSHKLAETDESKSSYADILRAAAVAVAGINTVMAIRMAKLQWEIAKDYLDIAKAWRDYYNNYFRPMEDIELEEAYKPYDYVMHTDFTVGEVRAVARVKSANQLELASQSTNEYSVGCRAARMKDQLANESFTLAAMSGMGERIEQARDDALRDRWWKRREQTLNRGRDMIANNVLFSQLAAGIFGDLGRQAAEGAAGAMAYLGYSGERQKTNYPGMMSVYSQYGGVGRSEPTFGGSLRGGGPAVHQDTITPMAPPDSSIDWDSRRKPTQIESALSMPQMTQ